MSTQQQQLETELAQARADLVASVDALTGRLSPKAQLQDFTDAAKQAATDTAGVFTGKGLPEGSHRSRNVKIVLGVAVAVVALGLRAVLRRS